MPISIKDAALFSTPASVKLKQFLDSAPSDQVFLTKEIERAAGLGLNTIYGASKRSDWTGYKLKVGMNLYWGSRTAIARLRKQLETK